MKWYVKLDGENIVGHVDSRHPGVNPADYDGQLNVGKLVDKDGYYIYKYVGGEAVLMDPTEFEANPVTFKRKTFEKVEHLYSKEEKKDKANKWKEVKKDPSLTIEEQAVIQELIDELEA
jgi:hypothetical protein